MKICQACRTSFSGDLWECPSCRHRPQAEGGHLVFSPESAEDYEGFEAGYFRQLAGLEEKHFWFRSRNFLILWAFRRYFSKASNFLEIGCGTGFVLAALEKAFPGIDLCGGEIYTEGLRFAEGRLGSARLFQMDARQIPFEEEFDVIGAFDVLEHIDEDRSVLGEIFRALKTGGGVMLTVPQHPRLWSRFDEISHHKRRYSRHELASKVESAGFRVELITSFFTFLLPLIVASRLGKDRTEKGAPGTRPLLEDLNISPVANAIFERICALERSALKRGVTFPAGGSLLCIGMKR